MNWIKKIIRPLLLFGLPLVVIACTVSYKFNGSSINYDKVKTISIADFPIKSEYVYAPLASKFNEDLKDIPKFYRNVLFRANAQIGITVY